MRKILAAGALGLILSVAGASNPQDQAPESRAYLGFSFGGERLAPRDFHYGLRLDHDSRFVEGPVAPLMQLDFTRQGLNAARISGLSMIRQETAAAEEVAERALLNYGVVDWGLLAVGALGLGYAANEMSTSNESASGGGTAGGGTTGGGTGGLLGGLPGGLSGLASPHAGADPGRDAEYRKWLDGGTGQMGDLGGG